MSEIIYHLKPFHPAGATQSGQPSCDTRTESARPTPQCQLASPDVSLTPEPVPARKRLDLAKGAEWCRILRATRETDEAGVKLIDRIGNLRDVATMVGTSAPTLSRLLKKFGSLSDIELTPERLAPTLTGGVESDWKFLLKQPAVRAKLMEIYVATMGSATAQSASDRRTAKVARTLLHFSHEPECPATLANRLREGYQPTDFVTFLRGNLTPEGEQTIRGPKHAQLYGQSARRDWTNRLPDGRRFETPASYTPSADDMSENHPFWVDYQGEPMISRQGLYCFFAKHKFPQSFELVARVRESYTAADILRFFFGMCQAMGGIPPFIEFEQGIWKSKMISGWRMDGDWLLEETVERPGMAKDQLQIVTEGLGLCGVTVRYQYSAHTKHVETLFNPLQTDIAVTARQFQHIGRYAGEYEYPSKQLRRVRTGVKHPRELGFASQVELADCIDEAMRRIRLQPSNVERDGNAQPGPGNFLTREEAHWADLAQCPLLPINDRLFAACIPGEMKKNTVINGYLNVDCNGKEYQFRHEDFAKLGDGYEVFYKIDKTNPNLGIAIYNRTSLSNSANFQKWKPGEFMFVAPRELPGPQFEVTSAPAGVQTFSVEELYGPGAVDQGDIGLKKQKKFVATQARHAPRPGQIGVRASSARDGKGNVVEVTNQATAAAKTQPEATAARRVGNAPAESLPARPAPAQPAPLPYNLRKILTEADTAAPK